MSKIRSLYAKSTQILAWKVMMLSVVIVALPLTSTAAGHTCFRSASCGKPASFTVKPNATVGDSCARCPSARSIASNHFCYKRSSAIDSAIGTAPMMCCLDHAASQALPRDSILTETFAKKAGVALLGVASDFRYLPRIDGARIASYFPYAVAPPLVGNPTEIVLLKQSFLI